MAKTQALVSDDLSPASVRPLLATRTRQRRVVPSPAFRRPDFWCPSLAGLQVSPEAPWCLWANTLPLKNSRKRPKTVFPGSFPAKRHRQAKFTV